MEEISGSVHKLVKECIIDDQPMEKCKVCGEMYYVGEKECDCWTCSACGESFSDFDMMGNRKEWLCLFCEDGRVNK